MDFDFALAGMLPVGDSDFRLIRKQHKLYVNKTRLVYRLVSRGNRYFLARPRRFGKSLLVSTLESFFCAEKELFTDTFIFPYLPGTPSKVVTLNFLELPPFENEEKFTGTFENYLLSKFSQVGFAWDVRSPKSFKTQFQEWLESQGPSSLVLLIDEYDSPFTRVFESNDLLDRVQKCMTWFYCLLDTCDSVFEFIFMTGITEAQNYPSCIGLNSMEDISLDPDFCTLMGFTEEEIMKAFPQFISNSASALRMTDKEIFDRLIVQYGGYCFEREGAVCVLNPWSVLCFFQRPEKGFQNHWFATGGNHLLFRQDLMAISPIYSKESDRKICSSPAKTAFEFSSIEIQKAQNLLRQTGYLTFKKSGYGKVFLDYPNQEIKESMRVPFQYFEAKENSEGSAT